MNERIGRWLAVGDVAEIFEWGSRVVKLYKSTAAKPVAFRKVAIQAALEASGLPVPPSGARKHRNCCLKVHVRALRQRVLVPPSMTKFGADRRGALVGREGRQPPARSRWVATTTWSERCLLTPCEGSSVAEGGRRSKLLLPPTLICRRWSGARRHRRRSRQARLAGAVVLAFSLTRCSLSRAARRNSRRPCRSWRARSRSSPTGSRPSAHRRRRCRRGDAWPTCRPARSSPRRP